MSGWCYSTGGDSIRSTAAGVLGYTVWSYFVFLVLPVLYTIAQVNLCKVRDYEGGLCEWLVYECMESRKSAVT